MAAGIKYHPHWQQTHAVTVKRGFRETPITNAPLEPQTPKPCPLGHFSLAADKGNKESKTAWSHVFLIQPSYLEAQDLSQDLNNACKHVR